ncbi:MAG: protein-disulfide reductase DsbD N-terminal domain-containing protein, partial [Acidobacteriota bacterium]|nr:protein-disulfide reductase DsbD N-terminal domain-containing protein [Acidobacteriota bacterium]
MLLVLPLVSLAQNPTKWSLESDAKGKTLKINETFKATLKAEIEMGWHLYSVEQPSGGPFPTKITLAENTPFKLEGKVETPMPITKLDPNFNVETKFFDGQAEFNLPVVTTDETNADALGVNVRFQVCNDTLCLPPKTVKVTFAGYEDVKRSRQPSAVGSQQ